MTDKPENLLELDENGWRQTLRQKREKWRQSHSTEQMVQLDQPDSIKQAQQLLNNVGAHQLLRDILKEYLEDQGVVVGLKGVEAGEYDLVWILMWADSLSNPVKPKNLEVADQCIFVGAANENLFAGSGIVNSKTLVNTKAVLPATTDSLQSVLLKILETVEQNEDNKQEKNKELKKLSKPKKAYVSQKFIWSFILVVLFLISFSIVSLFIYLLLVL